MRELHWALENRDEAEGIGLAARKRIEEEFSMDVIGRRLRSLYGKMLG